ncbi:MAG TPA: hypothetical protein VEX11_10760, partial [Acetobacteraceae bacterium]|nr:hypothetical protein [Acetobacteraceae bacterium]
MMMEGDLDEAGAAEHGVLDLSLPLGRRPIAQDAGGAQMHVLPARAVHDTRRGPELGVREGLLPWRDVHPMRGVGRDEVPHR